uniref:PROP1-like PPR domain-containing protein n=1 Tax=Oryza punctata TaxID=4537 RepID=A0A0E0LKF4_ORYPU
MLTPATAAVAVSGEPSISGAQSRLLPSAPPVGSRVHLPHLLPAPPALSSSRSHPSVPTPTASKSAAAAAAAGAAEAADLDPSDESLASMSPREQTALLSRQHHWRRARDLFDRMRALPGYAPSAIHYGVVIRHLARARRWGELRCVWARMAREGALPPTNPAYAALADALAKAGQARESLLLLRHMHARGVAPDEVSMNTFVRILKDVGSHSDAATLFDNWCNGRFQVGFIDLDYSAFDSGGPMQFLLEEMCHGNVDDVGASGIQGVARIPKLAVTYNTMIDLYGKAGKLKDAMDMFMGMPDYGVMADTCTFNTLINIFGSHGNVKEAEALFASMIVRGTNPDVKTFNVMMTLFASKGDVEGVLKHYYHIGKMGLSADTVSSRIVLRVLCERKIVHEAEDVIEGIMKSGTCVPEQSLPVVMKMYIDQGLLDKANAFFDRHCRGDEVSSKTFAAIMDAFAERALWEEAEHVFYVRGVRSRDIVEYNVMVKAYGAAKRYDRVSPLLEHMNESGISPDECTFNSLIQMFATGGFPQRTKKLLGKMKYAGFKPKCETYAAAITTFSRNYLVSEAIDLYNEMKASGVEPNVVVYGVLIDTFAETGQLEEALHYSNLMEESGIAPNQIVLTSLIKAYSKANCWKEAQDLYSRIENMDDGPDIVASNSMLNLYANLGMVTKVKEIFDCLRRNNQADDVSYTSMISLYKNMGLLNESVRVAHDLQNSGLLSDCASYNAVMACFAAKGKLRECAELVQQMQEDNILPDASMFGMIFSIMKRSKISPEEVSLLESAYHDNRSFSRQTVVALLFLTAGMHAAALNICEKYMTPVLTIDQCACNVAFKVYASCGEVDKAFSLFRQMHELGLKPDTATYIHLTTCYGEYGMPGGLRSVNGFLGHQNNDITIHKTVLRNEILIQFTQSPDKLTRSLGCPWLHAKCNVSTAASWKLSTSGKVTKHPGQHSFGAADILVCNAQPLEVS